MLYDSLELDQIKKVDLPSGDLSDSAIYRIKQIVYTACYMNDKSLKVRDDTDDDGYPLDWQWKWLVGKGSNYVGTLPRRISKLCYESGVNLSKDTLAAIGTEAKNGENTETSAYYDITAKINWKPGAFGDYGSCMWDRRGNGVKSLMESNVLALRLYKPTSEFNPSDYYYRNPIYLCFEGTELSGYGRAWAKFDHPQPGMICLWNGYGPKSNMSLHFARIMAYIFSLSYKRTEMYKQGTAWTYINSGSGYVLGTWEQIQSTEKLIPIPLEAYVEEKDYEVVF